MPVTKEAWRVSVESLLDLLELAGEGPAEKFRQAILEELRSLERQAFEAALAEDRLVLERIGRALELLEAQAGASGSSVLPEAHTDR